MAKGYKNQDTGFSVNRTARILGIGTETVKKIEAEALEKIHTYLEDKGISFDDLLP